MRWSGIRMITVGFALLVVPLAGAQEDLEARAEMAREAARANAESPEGRDWKRDNSHATHRLVALVMGRCLPDEGGDIPTAFSIFLRFSKAGQVEEIFTDLDASLERCMSLVARDLPFPEAPRDDYWVQVNMAAPL
jgi:hypothetical protein